MQNNVASESDQNVKNKNNCENDSLHSIFLLLSIIINNFFFFSLLFICLIISCHIHSLIFYLLMFYIYHLVSCLSCIFLYLRLFVILLYNSANLVMIQLIIYSQTLIDSPDYFAFPVCFH